MSLRDQTETLLRSWNAYETTRNSPPVVDFDCHPVAEPPPPAPNRLAVARELHRLHHEATAAGDDALARRLDAHRAYLDALLGARMPVREYIRVTQGCDAAGWSPEYIAHLGDIARSRLAALGIAWGPDTETQLHESEGPIDVEAAGDAVREAATDLEPAVRALTGATAEYHLTIENVTVDDYWAYWLDGSGADVRLRINLRNARFTKVLARVFALHEILGHGLQCASFTQHAATHDVPWVRLTSVHAQQQILLEGLAQALPFFVIPDDAQVLARIHVAHYADLVLAQQHLAVNAGTPVGECAAQIRQRIPFWDDARIGDALTDRSVNPLLRSYLWSYPAGLDWFWHLTQADPGTISAVFQAAYREPLSPSDLANLWPEGPAFGGPGITA